MAYNGLFYLALIAVGSAIGYDVLRNYLSPLMIAVIGIVISLFVGGTLGTVGAVMSAIAIANFFGKVTEQVISSA